jgi:hypothetical protein
MQALDGFLSTSSYTPDFTPEPLNVETPPMPSAPDVTPPAPTPMPTVNQPSVDTPAQRLYDCAQQHNCAGAF